MENIDLTICSVYHSSETKALLELNYDVVKKMNPGVQIRWIAADNTPKGFTDKIDEHKFTVVPGAESIRPVLGWLIGSYRHADALNNSLSHITTRFVVFLDMDFYIVRKDWMRDVILHMQEKNITFFGVPWHPVHFVKIRYFPGPQALFIDLKKVSVSQLDFRPCFDYIMHPTLWSRCARKIKKIKDAASKRMTIGTCPDTGFKIYCRFRDRATYEYVTPVFVPAVDLPHIPEATSMWEKILPDSLSYIPKKAGYYTESGFSSAGFPDARAQHWEEFMWNGHPFGFHIRGGTHKMRENTREKMQQLHRILAGFDALL